MANYLSPGIYVEEMASGPRPIEAIGTTTAGFVGLAPVAGARVNEPVAVNNFSQFAREFMNGTAASTPLAQAVHGFFQNGGSRCYVVNTGSEGVIAGDGKGLDQLAPIDEIALIAAPGRTDPASYDALLSAAERDGDRIALLDGPERATDIEALTRVGVVAHDDTKAASQQGGRPGLRPRESERGFGACYFPWLRVRDVVDPNRIISAPPSGYVAGICARTDVERGVHKAPANALVRGALGVTQAITKAEQELLNPSSINCFRVFGNTGVVLWGARTLAASASDWRYLNVRRLFTMVEGSIQRNTRWIVFEPNDRPLWQAIKRDVGAFLTVLWRQGALMGATPQQAFFVKCDEETNPPDVIDAGEVVTLIGLAPVKPAEFVVFRIGQTAVGTTIEAV
ncbi:phage tail sheath subtilisin-like domain-containing protein [Bradyrhizobium sp. SZCCHNS3051]|uniref:phage tail sheath subtilisin-like domain-containing protein n=1 Tax=Bradyrhizobium sp. SZCCHNS3051 TaxID=3057320 RepID=UPI0029167112|nr:phage tail sheath subtilisin-like domain-containing protein [Bradyrhizobium sp. SZCCHNS3051]